MWIVDYSAPPSRSAVQGDHSKGQSAALHTSLSPQWGEGLRVRGGNGRKRLTSAVPNPKQATGLCSSFDLPVRTMPTVVVATITAPEMIGCSENHQPISIKIIVPRNHRQRSGRRLLAVKCHYTVATEAGLIARFRRHTPEQFRRNVDRLTPTRAFVGVAGAKPTVISLTAQRTASRINGVGLHLTERLVSSSHVSWGLSPFSPAQGRREGWSSSLASLKSCVGQTRARQYPARRATRCPVRARRRTRQSPRYRPTHPRAQS